MKKIGAQGIGSVDRVTMTSVIVPRLDNQNASKGVLKATRRRSPSFGVVKNYFATGGGGPFF
jgi:hypothetical protein